MEKSFSIILIKAYQSVAHTALLSERCAALQRHCLGSELMKVDFFTFYKSVSTPLDFHFLSWPAIQFFQKHYLLSRRVSVCLS